LANLTTAAANKIGDSANGGTSWQPTGALKLALMTANGDANSAGTEVTGGSYARQTFTPTAYSGGVCSNSGTISFGPMPACTVVGVEIYDSAGTPFRIWWDSLNTARVVAAGDTASFAPGSLTLTFG
jgi:hypothetical protein